VAFWNLLIEIIALEQADIRKSTTWSAIRWPFLWSAPSINSFAGKRQWKVDKKWLAAASET
jgi:hypothetical protein